MNDLKREYLSINVKHAGKFGTFYYTGIIIIIIIVSQRVYGHAQVEFMWLIVYN